MKVRKFLKENSDKEYKEFSLKGSLTSYKTLGVRLPVIRKIAADMDIKEVNKYLDKKDLLYFEEYMLYGILIGKTDKDIPERIELIDWFLDKADSWAITDSSIISWKWIKDNKEIVYQYISDNLLSDVEMKRRGCILMAMYFYRDKFDEIVKTFNVEGKYYVEMMKAWYLSDLAIDYPDKVLRILMKDILSDFTRRKTISKIKESYRLSDEYKKKAELLR